MNVTDLKKRIMIKVYAIYALKKLREPFMAELFLFAVSVSVLPFLVSIPHIFSNVPKDVGGFSHYTFFALTRTRLVVQALVISMLLTGSALVASIASPYIAFIFPKRWQVNS